MSIYVRSEELPTGVVARRWRGNDAYPGVDGAADRFDRRWLDVGLRKEDRIELVANFNGVGEHATLVVDSVRQGKARVSLLCEYKRSQ